MATFAIGDVQGCFKTLRRLLEQTGFDPGEDRVWLVGDLINRGPRSLKALRWARALDEEHPGSLVLVLGNHDLHLLARAAGVRKPGKRDTLDDVLAASDREELLEWLRRRPLLHREGDHVMVHAGLLPAWSVEQAEKLAGKASARLSGERSEAGKFLKAIYRRDKTSRDPLAAAVDVMTLMRACTREGEAEYDYKGPLNGMPSGLFPWFAHPARVSAETTVVCGHWAALGLHQEPGVLALDSGCVWGNCLTAYRLEDGTVFQEPLAD